MGLLNLSVALGRAVLSRPAPTHYQLVRGLSRSTNPLFTTDPAAKVEASGETASQGDIDPFGIEEIVEKNPSIVVQGFYGHVYPSKDEKPAAAKGIPSGADPRESHPQSQSTGPDADTAAKLSKLQTYDSWLKHREETTARDRIGGPGENYRVASYGQLRLDSDNIVEQHGQYDQRNPPTKVPGGRTQWKAPADDTETKSPGDRMTASEFLKKVKQEKGEEEAEQKASQGPRVVEKKIKARAIKHHLQGELDEAADGNYSQDYLDSNVIPKVYQLPEYNKMTKQDMWSMLKSSVIFQNDFVIALNKPAGVPMHSPSVDCRHFITDFRDRLSDFGQCEQVYPIHRLDKETTGVLLFAKSPKVAKVIIEKFSTRQVEKRYLAITKLCPQMPEGTIKIPIGEGRVGGTEKFRSVLKPDLRKYEIKARRGDCKEAITHFTVLKSLREAAFLELRLETGVKHQIRLHLGLGIGCPVLGDQKYSHRDRMAPQRLHPILLHKLKVKQSKVRELPLHLHCNSISFTLPEEFTRSMEPVYIHAKVPWYFSHTLRSLGFSR